MGISKADFSRSFISLIFRLTDIFPNGCDTKHTTASSNYLAISTFSSCMENNNVFPCSSLFQATDRQALFIASRVTT